MERLLPLPCVCHITPPFLLPVVLSSSAECLDFVKHFLVSYNLGSDDLGAISGYKKHRNNLESFLRPSQVRIILDPQRALIESTRTSHEMSDDFEFPDSLVLLQSLNYSLEGNTGNYKILFKPSLLLDNTIMKALSKNKKIILDYSGIGLEHINGIDISNHYYLSIWALERLSCEDLRYSIVDEQVEEYKQKTTGLPLLYNINCASVNTGKGKRNISYQYNILLDINSGGVTCLEKNLIPNKGTAQLFRQMIIASKIF